MGWRTPDLLSPLSSAGVLLIFGAGAIATTRMTTLQIALLGLSHADALHGASESLLLVTNCLIAFGAYRCAAPSQTGGSAALR